ncbi:MAG: hypothetical protein V3R77_01140 [Candidatus Binatia bacterium]
MGTTTQANTNRNKLGRLGLVRLAAPAALAVVVVLIAAGCTKKPDPVEVVITIEETPGTLSNATLLVDYSQASASPLIAGGEPACASIQPHIDMTFSDDGGGAMSVEVSSSQGFAGPLEIAVCRMVPDAEGLSTDSINARLRVSLLTATGPDGRKVTDGRLARAGREASRGRSDGARAPSAPVGGIEPSQPNTGAAPRPPAMPQGEPTRQRSDPTHASTPPAGRAPSGASSPQDPYNDAPETVDDLLARRGTGTERRASTLVMGELDDKATAVADSSGEAGAPDQETNDEVEKDRTALTYDITVGVTSGAGLLAALQFDVRYTGDGAWLGSAGSVVCSTHPQVALATYNDRGGSWLSAAMIDLEGFDAVGPITTCRLKSREAVDAGSFSVTVIDAATPHTGDPNGGRPDPFPSMGVTDIRASN